MHIGSPPPTFLPLTVGGGVSGMAVFPMWDLPNVSPSQHFVPPPQESCQTTYPIPPTSLCHCTLLSLITCHTPHTHWPINSLPVTIIFPIITLRHNRTPMLHCIAPFLRHCDTICRYMHCRHRAKSIFRANCHQNPLSTNAINPGNYSPPLIHLRTLLIMDPKDKSVETYKYPFLPPPIDLDHIPLADKDYKITEPKCEFNFFELHF
jgi:hypothetical protein